MGLDPSETRQLRGEFEMPSHRHLELRNCGSDLVVRLPKHGRLYDEQLAEMAAEWNAVADRADCQTLCLDCSKSETLSSEMLSKLIVLHQRMQKKGGKLVLCGLRPAIQGILSCTKLDQFLEVQEAVTCT
jgi:anti-anti-sigma factor